MDKGKEAGGMEKVRHPWNKARPMDNASDNKNTSRKRYLVSILFFKGGYVMDI